MGTQRAFTIWFTGLPASGKSTLATAVAQQLTAQGWPVEVIDSGKLRRTPLGASLGFSRGDRDLNVRRHALAAGLLARNGVVALVTAVSPYRATRDQIRAELGDLIEVHVDTPPEVCVQRDPSGLWRRALAGELQGFTGVDDPYEPPLHPEARVDLSETTPGDGAAQVLAALAAAGLLGPRSADADAEREQLHGRLEALGYT